jgi:ribosomal protein S1
MMSDPRDAKTDSFAALFEKDARTTTRQRKLSPGDKLEVAVVKTTRDAVFVDIDGKREAFIDIVDSSVPTVKW